MPGDLCVAVGRKDGERIRKYLLQKGLLDLSRKISSLDDRVLIPIAREILTDELANMREVAPLELVSAELCLSNRNPVTLQELLAEKIPQNLLPLIPKSYDAVGDLLVLEDLPDLLIPYKKEIGSALLKAVPSSKAALLKIGKVEGEFRLPQLEFVAGERRSDTIYTEYGVRLRVDLSKAYFSSRLGFERYRVAKSVSDGETVVDLFAGVGPFSIMIAKYVRARVFAIDINPAAIHLLEENIKLNRLRGEVIPICGDAASSAEKLEGKADRAIMNLPGKSLEYLGTALKVIKGKGGMIHLYTFASGEPLATAESNFKDAAGKMNRTCYVVGSRIVKPVAPKKWQVALDISVS